MSSGKCAALNVMLLAVLAACTPSYTDGGDDDVLRPEVRQGPPASARVLALEEYVQRPDPAYQWSMYHQSSSFLARYYFLKLDSQTWLDSSRVDRALWTHELTLAQPRPALCRQPKKTSGVAILMIRGGRNDRQGDWRRTPRAGRGFLAQTFCRPVFELHQVPNQPLVFSGELDGRKEDALLAFSLDQYLETGASDWPAHLAMVKSVTQAMTAIQEFSRTREEIPDVDQFVLIGGSKRGWTAWLTAAVDPRVRAIVPVSIDMPNLGEQLSHHWRSYGDYAPTLSDYAAFDFGCRVHSARGEVLLGMIDPIAYRERLTLPKLIMNSAGDEFFVSDSSRWYYPQLLGSKRLRYTVNTGHRQGGRADRAQLFFMARNWINDVLSGRQPPALDWHTDVDGTLVVQASETPREVLLWTADNPDARDFRLTTIGPAWRSVALAADADGRYRARPEVPANGWRAFLVEARFGGWFERNQQIYTTDIQVVPQHLPFPPPPCRPETLDQAATVPYVALR